MATGDQNDWIGRLTAVLPGAWFPARGTNTATTPINTVSGQIITTVGGQPINVTASATTPAPVLTGILAGFASMWASVYLLYTYIKAQTRLATATDTWVDMWQADFFSPQQLAPRLAAESDAALKARTQGALLAPRATRLSLKNVLTALTGRVPRIVEPSQTMDTGAYGTGSTIAYGAAGAYGSLKAPFFTFVTVYRTFGPAGTASVAGYGTAYYGYGGGGRGSYVSQQNYTVTQLQVTDAQVYAAVAATQPDGVTCWTAITN